MKFLLGSSFFCGGPRNVRDLSEDWCLNLTRIDVNPEHVAIICEGGTKLKFTPPGASIIELTGDLGNWSDIMHKRKLYEWSGWSASMVTLAMLAYINECDFIYKESDCFAFGDWVRQLYADMSDGEMAFGPPHTSSPWMASSQSLFIVRHSFIPVFVREYLAMGGETSEMTLGEMKFKCMRDKLGAGICRHLTFGQDRMRPIDWITNTNYWQQPTSNELQEARMRGLL